MTELSVFIPDDELKYRAELTIKTLKNNGRVNLRFGNMTILRRGEELYIEQVAISHLAHGVFHDKMVKSRYAKSVLLREIRSSVIGAERMLEFIFIDMKKNLAKHIHGQEAPK